MMDTLLQQWRRYLRVAAFAVLGLLSGALIAWNLQVAIAPSFQLDTNSYQEVTSTDIDGEIMTESLPTRLRIPKIDVDTTFTEPLGLDENQEVDIPYDFERVGWYKYGPTPGELGPAVILGHVDSFEGAAVFYHLGQLEAGDRVFVDREDGSTAIFEVTTYERPSQDDFPTQKVYGNINFAGLRLVTCTGQFDKGEQRYSHNLVVYAKLVEVVNEL